MQSHLLDSRGSVILGALYRNCGGPDDPNPCSIARLSDGEKREILQSHGHSLTERFWGDYVAILQATSARGHTVIKDPTGSLPCHIAPLTPSAHIVFSDVADVIAARLLRLQVSRHYLQRRLSAPTQTPDLESLEGIRRVFGGERIEIRSSRMLRSTQLWRPDAAVNRLGPLDDPSVASTVVRASIQSATRTWAQAFGRLLLRCSGGLDSSILAGCLVPTDPSKIIAYTYTSTAGDANAWPWARQALQSLGCTHIRVSLDPSSLQLDKGLTVPPAVEPAPVLAYYQRSEIEGRLAAENDSAAVMCGDGGDSGFGRHSIPDVVLDTVLRRGPSIPTVKAAAAVARYTHESLYGVLIRTALDFLNIHRSHRADCDLQRLVDKDILANHSSVRSDTHPWFQDVPYASIARRRIGGLISNNDYYNARGESARPVIAPLWSQPVVEQLLRIPLQILFLNGCDRGLARQAFLGLVPAPILDRTWKDRAPGFLESLIMVNRRLLLEVFLDGMLVREKMLDRQAVERALSPTSSLKAIAYPAEIFQHLETELWLRQWQSGA